MSTLRCQLEDRVSQALAAALGDVGAGVDPQIQPARDPAHGDWQSNVAMGLGGKARRKPRELAQAVVDALRIDDMCEPAEIAGPGFINFRLKPAFLAAQLRAIQADPRLGIPVADNADVVAIDFLSVNLAKEMHVGHLRSAIIGESLARVLEWLGHRAERINHVGDWGTQFGMLLQFVRESQPQVLDDPESFQVGDLESFYGQAQARFDGDAGFADAARRTVGDVPVRRRRLWRVPAPCHFKTYPPNLGSLFRRQAQRAADFLSCLSRKVCLVRTCRNFPWRSAPVRADDGW